MKHPDGKIHIKGRLVEKLKPGQQPVVRVSREAFDTLVELANESQWSMSRIATEIITQGSELVVFDRDAAGAQEHG